MKRIVLRQFAVVSLVALGLPGCMGEAIDSDEEQVDQVEEALCDINEPCEPPPPTPKPNLTVVSPPPGYCGLVGPNTVLVTVTNNGSAWARSSNTRVTFYTYYGSVPVTQSTPALNPGDSIDYYFTIPDGCYQSDCEFSIRVDSTNVVVESNESNTFWRTCLG